MKNYKDINCCLWNCLVVITIHIIKFSNVCIENSWLQLKYLTSYKKLFNRCTPLTTVFKSSVIQHHVRQLNILEKKILEIYFSYIHVQNLTSGSFNFLGCT